MERAAALRELPITYAMALRLRDGGLDPVAIAACLDVAPEAVPALLAIGERKLEALMASGGHGEQRTRHREQ